jgi:hypothetical protein
MQSFSNGVMTGVSSPWVMYRVSEANTSQVSRQLTPMQHSFHHHFKQWKSCPVAAFDMILIIWR